MPDVLIGASDLNEAYFTTSCQRHNSPKAKRFAVSKTNFVTSHIQHVLHLSLRSFSIITGLLCHASPVFYVLISFCFRTGTSSLLVCVVMASSSDVLVAVWDLDSDLSGPPTDLEDVMASSINEDLMDTNLNASAGSKRNANSQQSSHDDNQRAVKRVRILQQRRCSLEKLPTEVSLAIQETRNFY